MDNQSKKVLLDQYAVYGNPIAHSKSPAIHKLFAEQTQQSLQYNKVLVDINNFSIKAKQFFDEGGKGLNVTVPFKQDAYSFADNLTQRAKLAGAVNTLALHDDGMILGDNTDGVGMVDDISLRHGWAVKNRNILIIGAGGAVRGILYPLLGHDPKSVTIVNRTLSKAQALAATFSPYGKVKAISFDELNGKSMAEKTGDTCHSFDLIINGSSAGLSKDIPPLSADYIHSHCYIYDMVYGQELTAFLRWAKEHGAQFLADGLGMLVGQAAESFYVWRGVKPDVMPVINFLKNDKPNV